MPTDDQYINAYIKAKQAGDEEAAGYFKRKIPEAAKERYKPESKSPFWENLGAGMMDVVKGTGQLVGAVSSEDIQEKQRIDEQLAKEMTGGGLVQAAGNIAATAPLALIPGVGTAGGAALVGAGTGALMPTADDNVISGKAKQAALGGLLGGATQKVFNVAGSALPKAFQMAKEEAARYGLGTAGTRQKIAEDAFLQAVPQAQRGQALAKTQGYQPIIPGSSMTTAELTQEPGLLGLQRLAQETGGPASEALRARTGAANTARLRYLEGELEQGWAPQWRKDAGDFAERAKAGMQLKSSGFDPTMKTASQLDSLIDTSTGTIKSTLEGLKKELIEARAAAGRTGSIEPLHQFRMTSLDDALSRMYREGATKGQKTLRIALSDIKDTFDKEMDRALVGNKQWSGFLEGYGQRAQRAGQLEAGEELLTKIGEAAPLATGEANLGASTARLRKTLSSGLTDEYGNKVYTPRAEQALKDVHEELAAAQAPYAADVAPRGSATAENLRQAERVFQAGAQPRLSPADVAMMQLFQGSPLAAAKSFVLKHATDKMQARAADDIAQRLLTLVRDPQAAAAVLQRAQIPPAAKSQIAAALAKVQPIGITAGAVAGG